MKILESEVYTGDLVQGKTKIVDHQQVKAGEDNLIVAKGTHEPIISRELLQRCRNTGNRYVRKAGRFPNNPIPRIFSKERYSVQTAAGAFTGSGRNAKKARMFTIFIALPTAGYSKKAVKA